MPHEQSTEQRSFSAVATREGGWFVAQCLEIDVASQGLSEDEALDNLREALELYLEDPRPTEAPHIMRIEVRTSVA